MKLRDALVVLLVVSPALACAGERPEIRTIAGKQYCVIPDKVVRELGFDIPRIPPDKNAAHDYLRAINACQAIEDWKLGKAFDHVARHGWSEEAEPLRKHVERNAAALRHARAGAAKKQCHFPFLYSAETDADEPTHIWLLPSLLSKQRDLGRLLAGAGAIHEEQGQWSLALDDYTAVVALGTHVGQDPLIVTGLVGKLIAVTGLHAIQRCAVQHDVDEKILLKAQQRLAALRELRRSYAAVLRSERVWEQLALEHELERGCFDEIRLYKTPPRWKLRLAKALLQSAAFQGDVREYHEAVHDVLEALANRPMPEFVTQCEAELRKAGDGFAFRLPEALLGDGTHGLVRARHQYARSTLEWTATDIFLALARYRAKHGKHPERLDEVKNLMLSDGIDPFSGELLKYRREADGSFTLWSVGEDLTDGGGEQGASRWDGPDYVWHSAVIGGAR